MVSIQENTSAIDMATIDTKLDRIQEQIATLVQRQRYQSELIDEMWPIVNEVVKASTETLNDFESKGYFAFAREGIHIIDKVVENYSEDDVRQLAESIVDILDTVKTITQPEVLAIANEATGALSVTKAVKPRSLFGMFKATGDADVKYGMAVVFEVLRQVGRGGRRTAAKATSAGKRRQRLQNKLQPTGRMARPAAASSPRRNQPSSRSAPKSAPAAAKPAILDPSEWTREICEQLAAAEGLTLTDAHWQILDFARNEFLEKGASPNIRRITSGLEVTTKDIYQLFPKAPARTVSVLAGIPKPAGCI